MNREVIRFVVKISDAQSSANLKSIDEFPVLSRSATVADRAVAVFEMWYAATHRGYGLKYFELPILSRVPAWGR